MSRATTVRIGGHLVVESLEALGAEVAFGLPGIHALAIWEALRTSEIRDLAFRTELNAGFAADGYARVSGRPAPLILSTGPGALISLASLMEAASSHVPVVAIASQIPSALLGGGRGYLHELPDQRASFAPIVKWAGRPEDAESIPATLTEAWRHASTPPTGPVFVEIPVDFLTAETELPPVEELNAAPGAPPVPTEAVLAHAAGILNQARNLVIWAGGGVIRSGAWDELRAVAEQLQAPVATTFMGKGAFPEDHPLFAGSACYDARMRELLEGADVLLCVGTELGSETTFDYTLRPTAQIIQIDVAAERIGATYEALGIVGDARDTLETLLIRLEPSTHDGAGRAAAARERLAGALSAAGYELELGLLDTIRAALARDAVHAWDMTILAYDASCYFPALSPRRFLYPLGSGTLGYAWPAALGASVRFRGPRPSPLRETVGIHYGLTELATARQYGLDAKLLLVDDGGYGVLREYQQEAFGETHAVDLTQPDFPAVCAAFGVPVRPATPETLAEDLDWAFGVEGPAVVVLATTVRWIQP